MTAQLGALDTDRAGKQARRDPRIHANLPVPRTGEKHQPERSALSGAQPSGSARPARSRVRRAGGVTRTHEVAVMPRG